MAWYIVFHGRKHGVYESWGVYCEYVVDFSGAALQSYLTRMEAKEAYEAFLEHIVKKENMSLTSGVKKIGRY
jgi:viroplasmin and RNaseH domain-containing protein